MYFVDTQAIRKGAKVKEVDILWTYSVEPSSMMKQEKGDVAINIKDCGDIHVQP